MTSQPNTQRNHGQHNQRDQVKQRRPGNVVLLLIFIALLVAVGTEVRREINRLNKKSEPLTATEIRIIRAPNTVILQKKPRQTVAQTKAQTKVQTGPSPDVSRWQVLSPYQYAASEAVVNALLERLQNGCRALTATPTRQPQFYAEIAIDGDSYHVGELNTASDEVYVRHGQTLLLCDKLLASMALAPAINFIDKQLYHGKLSAIIGDFGRLSDFNGVDLSVLEIAPAQGDKLPKNAVSTLTFVADGGEQQYRAFASDDGNHILLFEPKKSVIYVIAAQAKLNAVLGL